MQPWKCIYFVLNETQLRFVGSGQKEALESKGKKFVLKDYGTEQLNLLLHHFGRKLPLRERFDEERKEFVGSKSYERGPIVNSDKVRKEWNYLRKVLKNFLNPSLPFRSQWREIWREEWENLSEIGKLVQIALCLPLTNGNILGII